MSPSIFISLSIIVIMGLIGIFMAKPWELPETRIEKWKRSITLGLFTSLALSMGLISYSLLDTSGKGFNTPQLWNIFYPIICCILPLSLFTTLGYYFGYAQLNWLQKVKDKLSLRS